jgi:hypothetical protein
MAFLERFPPFNVKRGVTVAKPNRFWHHTSESLISSIADQDPVVGMFFFYFLF